MLIPAKLHPDQGDDFAGRFGLLLARRPSDGKWVVVGLKARDMPLDRSVIMPPL